MDRNKPRTNTEKIQRTLIGVGIAWDSAEYRKVLSLSIELPNLGEVS